MPKDDIPFYSDLFESLLDALKVLGGSGKPPEVRDYLAKHHKLSDTALEITQKNGTQKFMNRVQWARFYLAKYGHIDSSKRGVWSLTDAGRNAVINEKSKQDIINTVAKEHAVRKPVLDDPAGGTGLLDETEPDGDGCRSHAIEILQAMTPDSFERLCQRILREAGFEEVNVTGRSGDGGIDGNGILKLNPFVSFQVAFQCKRYRDTVGSPVVRDFRGAMSGRADKGIILTTGTFSQAARREATRDGVPTIELVDGDKLLDLLEKYELGLTATQIFKIDEKFFQNL